MRSGRAISGLTVCVWIRLLAGTGAVDPNSRPMILMVTDRIQERRSCSNRSPERDTGNLLYMGIILYEPFRLAVGFRRVGFGADVADAEVSAGSPEGVEFVA